MSGAAGIAIIRIANDIERAAEELTADEEVILMALMLAISRRIATIAKDHEGASNGAAMAAMHIGALTAAEFILRAKV